MQTSGIMGTLAIIQSDPEVPVGVFAPLLAEWRVPWSLLRADRAEPFPGELTAVIVLGGTMGVHEDVRYPFLTSLKAVLRRLLAKDLPLLGICLGGQLLADLGGGTVRSNCCGERGLKTVSLTPAGAADPLFANLPPQFQAFQWHNDSFAIPPGARHLAGSVDCPGQAFRLGSAWGLQFHPEVDAAIVAAWSRRDPCADQLRAAFAAGEAAHRQMARQLLVNFLICAGFHCGP